MLLMNNTIYKKKKKKNKFSIKKKFKNNKPNEFYKYIIIPFLIK